MSYMSILGVQRKMDIATLVWNRAAQLKQGLIVWLDANREVTYKGQTGST